jgi:hypothetical protein
MELLNVLLIGAVLILIATNVITYRRYRHWQAIAEYNKKELNLLAFRHP